MREFFISLQGKEIIDCILLGFSRGKYSHPGIISHRWTCSWVLSSKRNFLGLKTSWISCNVPPGTKENSHCLPCKTMTYESKMYFLGEIIVWDMHFIFKSSNWVTKLTDLCSLSNMYSEMLPAVFYAMFKQ